jgi:hypothetical protein
MYFIIILTLIVALISPAVKAGEKTVTVPIPRSITLVCSDDVEKGTVVLTNPPKFSCKDYETIKSVIGMGIVIGPDTRVQKISAEINRINRKQKRKSRIASVTRKDNTSSYKMKSGNNVVRKENVPVVRASTRPMKVRLENWTSPTKEFVPIPQPIFKKDNLVNRDDLLNALIRTDEEAQWKTIDYDEYEKFNGFSRNRKFFRD